jgi:hypothetical protein
MLSSGMLRPAGLAAVAAAIAGCWEPDSFSGDPFPVGYVSRGGAVTLEVRTGDEPARAAVIDVLSPFTVLDDGVATEPSRDWIDLDVLGAGATGSIPRAQLTGTVLRFHPCGADPTCSVGDPAAPFPVGAMIGTDLLSGDAIRFHFAASQLHILPDVAGTSTERTALCDGVFLRPFQGFGTLVLEGAEVGFVSKRTVIEACLGPDVQLATAPSQRGGDALFVMSTGLGANLLTESAYLRYLDSTAADIPPLDTLPSTTVQVISGPITGRLGSIPELALTATAPNDPRGPCRENYASSYLETVNETNVCPEGVDCPCDSSTDRRCSAPAVVRLTPAAGIPIVIVPDVDPLLQALRAELRPLVGEIDGILGTDVLAPIQVDLDYPHDRLLWRCTTADGCVVRPELDGLARRDEFLACLAAGPIGPIDRGAGEAR